MVDKVYQPKNLQRAEEHELIGYLNAVRHMPTLANQVGNHAVVFALQN